ncbi:MAG: 3-isopropylmalate dehydratase small subunit [Candidatus Aminicenantes bacterium]|nr:3-isopropylmalate dehydratase small subunit [Candidatus Aminicenantes bacterium]
MIGKFTGKAWKYGDNINTDVIFPGKYTYQKMEPEEMAKHALEDLDPEFTSKVKQGDILVAGKNFGMGSSREQAATAVKYAGIRVVIARSFARIYFRNAINAGMPAIKSPEAVDAIENGEEVTVDMAKGEIITNKGTFTFPPYPETVMKILENNGLINFIKSIIQT